MLDELIPPIIRDSFWFMYPIFYIVYKGRDIRRKMNFKSIAYSLSEEEYNAFYNEIDAISGRRNTDLSASNIRYILAMIPADSRSILDVGCGKGFLLDRIGRLLPDAELSGLDVENRLRYEGIGFTSGSVTRLPFPDKHFDTVICTHTVEHIIPIQQAVDELIRVTKRQLIVVTPCQRYFYYTLDGHMHFFYKAEELLRYFRGRGLADGCVKLGMDWVYLGYRGAE